MKKFLIIVMFLSSGCGVANQLNEKKIKKCCEKHIQAVYEYESLTVK